MQILQRAEKVMSAYIGRNFFLRSILSTSDQKSFDDLEKDIKDCMQVWRFGQIAGGSPSAIAYQALFL